MLKKYCTVCNYDDDGLIGIQLKEGVPHISFPRGYSLSESDEMVRRDILCLISVLYKFGNQNKGETIDTEGVYHTSLPILSFQYVIQDFLAHGYYTEQSVQYNIRNQGIINWKRTIQKIPPQIDNGNIIYLDFVTKNNINSANILTRIHEYCVYESFLKLGWLFISSEYLPKKPSIQLNKRMFISVLRDTLKHTFNADKKRLLMCMIEIIENANETTSTQNYFFGVTRFEYVWEKLIDHVFGEDNKSIFFPHAKWHIVQGGRTESSPLKPDTIMLFDRKLFILDAKYYKFGITGIPTHLPATSSIQKQITYGEYIAEKQFANKMQIFNAFVMPYESHSNDEYLKFVSVGTADWIDYSPSTENYKYILGILMDTKHIINTYARHNEMEILRIADLITTSLEIYRSSLESS